NIEAQASYLRTQPIYTAPFYNETPNPYLAGDFYGFGFPPVYYVPVRSHHYRPEHEHEPRPGDAGTPHRMHPPPSPPPRLPPFIRSTTAQTTTPPPSVPLPLPRNIPAQGLYPHQNVPRMHEAIPPVLASRIPSNLASIHPVHPAPSVNFVPNQFPQPALNRPPPPPPPMNHPLSPQAVPIPPPPTVSPPAPIQRFPGHALP
ncbi:MAG TPA: hypothetical protein VKC60_00580, partial [Opitutaceae bacterium]|nr:hypothetical protein [Opitutaceae bacterium]